MRGVVVLIALIVLCQAALAQSGTINLLAVAENPDGSTSGTLATLSLEVRPGAEHVFLETIPLTKVATQISMRFAQQIACKELAADCSHDDFIYTIEAAPGLVGGPSAGAAAAVLTTSLLRGDTLRSDMAITGTINAGGIIGPVGGVKEKIQAAGSQGITTVLLPMGTQIVNDTNTTLNLSDWGRLNNVTVIEVATLDDAYYQFTNKNITRPLPPFTIDPAYQDRMKMVGGLICKRMEKLLQVTANIVLDNETRPLHDAALNYSQRAIELGNAGAYYSAASYCFRANVELNDLNSYNITTKQISDRLRKVFDNLATLNNETQARTLNTMTDLQTYMSVNERIIETADTLVEASKALQQDDRESAEALLVYAEERYVSAASWSAFFGLGGRQLVLDQEALRQSCYTKISEAEERYAYVSTLFVNALQDTRVTLDRAHQDAQNQSYATCLAKASKAKAEADVLLTLSSYEERQADDVITLELQVAQRQMVEAQLQGDFPLIGYNYYQYANDLRNDDKYSSLLFAEYSLELSNLDLYFHRQKPSWQTYVESELVLPRGTLLLVIFTAMAAGAAIASGYVLSSQVAAQRKEKERLAHEARRVEIYETSYKKGDNKPSPTLLAKRRRGKKR